MRTDDVDELTTRENDDDVDGEYKARVGGGGEVAGKILKNNYVIEES